MRLSEYKPKPVVGKPEGKPCRKPVESLEAWAEGLLEGRPDVRVEIPGFYGDARIAFKKVSTPAELAELRQQAEALGLSGIVWSGVEAGRDLLDRWQALESEAAA